MWFFSSSQSLQDSRLFQGFTDWHCHILPGVDDGVQSMEEANALLSKYEQMGVKEVWLTPHVMEDMPNSTDGLRERFAKLEGKYRGNIKLNLASENMLDNLFNERLEKNDFLPIGDNRDHLLVETSYFNPPMDLYGTMEDIKKRGYYPILAHPERYAYMTDRDYRKLKDMGVKFQLNIGSVLGFYGRQAELISLILMKEKMYDYKGTDTHTFNHFSRMLKGQLKTKELKKVISI